MFSLRWGRSKVVTCCKICLLVMGFVRERGGLVTGGLDLVKTVIFIFRNHGVHGLFNTIISYGESRKVLQADLGTSSHLSGSVVSRSQQLATRTVPVDIIICIHNAMDDVQRCLESVRSKTEQPYTLILVDDGSDQPLATFLQEFALQRGAKLIRNDLALGYTRAANLGLAHSSAPYAVLLNSDTIVTTQWLDRLVACAESEGSIGIVGPLSNTASWQSVPDVENNGDWGLNPIPEPFGIEDMARLVARDSARIHPRMPLLNGFCLLIKRELLMRVGNFDEESFGQGYGEENDLCLRARQDGWHLALADDAYIYHAQSRSYSNERRDKLCKIAQLNLLKKHGKQVIDESVAYCRSDRSLLGIRARAGQAFSRERLRREGRERWGGRSILFLLPAVEVGGGANVVIQESLAMKEMGVDVRILNLERFRRSFEVKYPFEEHALSVVYAKNEKDIGRIAHEFDAVVATANYSVKWLSTLAPDKRRGYYIQDFEPYFYEPASKAYRQSWESYTLFPDLKRFTKTDWNRRAVLESIGVDCALVGPSVDCDLFRPKPRQTGSWPRRPLQVVAMIRPSSARRGPALTMEVLRDVAGEFGATVEFHLFGCHENAPDFKALATDFPWKCWGVLTRAESAWLLNEADIFVDFSSFQAMGLTALEAMACGAAVIVPENGGADSFARHEINALVIDTASRQNCREGLCRLITDHSLRLRLQENAIRDSAAFSPETAAYNILKAIFTES